MDQRNTLLDYLRGIAIFLVVLGHTIQYSTRGEGFFSNPVFILIYTFHMPLFMLISGYLFFASQAKRSLKQLVQAKAKQILIPLLLWAFAIVLVNNRGTLVHHLADWRIIFTWANYWGSVVAGLWFLWTSFVCAVVTALISKKLGDSIWAYVGATLLILALPNTNYFYFVKYMLPFFFTGYLYHKHAARLQLTKKILIYLSFLAYPLLVLYWQTDFYIYKSGESFSLFSSHNLLIITYRYTIGLFGIILFGTVVKYLLFFPKARLVIWLGKNSLGIYVISTLGFLLAVKWMQQLPHGSVVLYSLLLAPTAALLIAVLSGAATRVISQQAFLNRYLLGGR